MFARREVFTSVVMALTVVTNAAAEAPRNGHLGKEGRGHSQIVPGFGNEFESRPVPGFGAQETASESSGPPLFAARGKQAAADSSQPTLGVRSLSTPQHRVAATKDVARRFRTAVEFLPEGLPHWFHTKDVNRDGQIAMAEYATDWNDDKVSDYQKWDLNGDGMIIPSEVLKVAGVDAAQRAKSPAKTADILRQADPPAVRAAQAIQLRNERRAESLVHTFLARYDRDGTGALEGWEWADLPWQNPRRWDANVDRRLTADEIAAHFANATSH